MRFFNTAGPVRCQDHYCIPPLTRFELDEILMLIEQKKYFILHAPRQVGKTSYLLALRDYLNKQGRYRCVYFNVEVAQTDRENVPNAMRSLLGEMVSRARTTLDDSFPQSVWQDVLRENGGAALNPVLTRWAEASPKPLILLIDEIDSLVGDTLISVLRQLRAGYDKRPASFPQSVILCGVRDLHDYRIHASREKAVITGGSAFNIKAASLRMDDFERQEVETLVQQHTSETGQVFEPAALEQIWELAQGQPWLVNALAYEVCFRIKSGRDRALPITSEMVFTAKENLILRRETHLDQLVHKLQEERVQRVISPMLQGIDLDYTARQDDIQYVVDLGLVRRGQTGLQVANPIYREVIPREISYVVQLNLESTFQPAWYITPDGRLDVEKLLAEYQQFFREHSEHWVGRFDYKKAGPQLLLQAFLQRIVNSGGSVEREYGLGRGRTDLLVIWRFGARPAAAAQGRPHRDQIQKTVLELKLRRGSLDKTIQKGLEQTWEYMDRCGTDEGHLVIFDQGKKRTWEEKVFRREESYHGHPIRVWGMWLNSK